METISWMLLVAMGTCFENESMDVITVSCAFHHFEDPKAFTRECMRILTKNGRVYMAEPLFSPMVRWLANTVVFPFSKHCYHKKPCEGCLKSDKGKPEHCRKCKLKDCVKEKNLSYCYECDSYPCKQIKALEKSYNTRYHKSLMENSKSVRDMGYLPLWNNSVKYIPVRVVGVCLVGINDCPAHTPKSRFISSSTLSAEYTLP